VHCSSSCSGKINTLIQGGGDGKLSVKAAPWHNGLGTRIHQAAVKQAPLSRTCTALSWCALQQQLQWQQQCTHAHGVGEGGRPGAWSYRWERPQSGTAGQQEVGPPGQGAAITPLSQKVAINVPQFCWQLHCIGKSNTLKGGGGAFGPA
jgi:hypothetical protein